MSAACTLLCCAQLGVCGHCRPQGSGTAGKCGWSRAQVSPRAGAQPCTPAGLWVPILGQQLSAPALRSLHSPAGREEQHSALWSAWPVLRRALHGTADSGALREGLCHPSVTHQSSREAKNWSSVSYLQQELQCSLSQA